MLKKLIDKIKENVAGWKSTLAGFILLGWATYIIIHTKSWGEASLPAAAGMTLVFGVKL